MRPIEVELGLTMVKIGQVNDTAIREVPYQPAEQGLPLEVLNLASLKTRLDDIGLRRPERIDFNMALICTEGIGIHEVDFTEVELKPLRVVHIRPGQVHRWRFDRGDYHAVLILFPEMMSLRPPGWASGRRCYDLEPADWNATRGVLSLLNLEGSSTGTPERRNRALEAIRELLILHLKLDGDDDVVARPLHPAYAGFRDLIEDQSSWSRSVISLAHELGYSPRTITRICKDATGRTAKELMDERMLLESRRLLAHTDRTVASIGHELAFSEATNFTKFFRRLTGETPAQWRRSLTLPLVPRT